MPFDNPMMVHVKARIAQKLGKQAPTERTRFFGFHAVTKDASASGTPVYTFKASDGEYDRANDRIFLTGWDIEGFNKLQGPILYNHDDGGSPLGTRDPKVLPIGKGRAYVKGAALFVDVTFDPHDEFAQSVRRKVDDGYLGAVSVRYTMKEWVINERGGFDSLKQELLEISVVSIPCNSRALLDGSTTIGKAFEDYLVANGSAAAERAALKQELKSEIAAELEEEKLARMSPQQRETYRHCKAAAERDLDRRYPYRNG